MYSWFVKENGVKLIDFISSKLSISKSKAKKLIDSKLVFVNSQRIWIATHLLNYNDIVELYGIPERKDLKIDIIYEDDYIIVVNKPPFIATNETSSSLEFILKSAKQSENIKAIHRLDKETSGIVIFAKKNEVYEKFKELWKRKEVKKVYLAICYGGSKFNEKWINDRIDGKPATSLVKLIKSKGGFSYFEIEIITGRKHQVRKHLSSIRHPIVGDKVYGINFLDSEDLKSVKRQLLHSYKIEFICPFSGEKKKFFAPLPRDFKEVLRKLLFYQA